MDGWVAENRAACCYFYRLSTPETWPLCGLLAEVEAAKLSCRPPLAVASLVQPPPAGKTGREGRRMLF